MKYRSGLAVWAVCFCLTAFLLFTRCGASTKDTVPPLPATVTVAPYPDNPGDRIPVTVNPCADDPEGKIRVKDIAVTPGILDGKESYSPLHGNFKAGDPCFLVSGRLTNNYKETSWVAYHAHGYDSAGNEAAFTLDQGPISGVGQEGIDANSSETFIIHLSWADNVTSMEISFQRAGQMFP